MNRKELQKLQADDEKYSDMYSDLTPEQNEALDDMAFLNTEEMEQEYRYQMNLEASYGFQIC